MKKEIFILLISCLSIHFVSGQVAMSESLIKARDSSLHAAYKADSMKISKEFAEKAKWERHISKAEYPLLKGGIYSGVIPVKDVTEIPDPNIAYKLLFELTENNPDSIAGEINSGLTEIARIINLHIASGVPVKNIFPVIVVHAGALNALKNNEAFQKKYKMDNPSIKLIQDMEKMGGKFIACGQAMEMLEIKKADLLPEVKISLTAKTVVTSYQLKGYVWHQLQP